MPEKPAFENGDEVVDTLSGFTGIITATVTYLHGETRYQVTGTSENGKKPDEDWIDEGRLSIAYKPLND